MLRILVLLAALLPVAAQAQLSTDRPGFGFDPSTVGRGTLQIEAGVPDATFGEAVDTYSFNAAARLGLFSRLELRAATSIYDIVKVEGGEDEGDFGFNSVRFGGKLAISGGSRPLALIPEVTVPLEESGDVFYDLNAVGGFRIDAASFTFVAGAGTGDDVTRINLAGVLSTPFSPIVTGYVEVAAQPTDYDTGSVTPLYAGGGLLYLLNANTQIDVYVDAGLNDDAADGLFGFGITRRFQ